MNRLGSPNLWRHERIRVASGESRLVQMGVAGALLPSAWCIQFRARAAIGRYGIRPIEEKIPTLQLSREYIRRAGETGDGLPRSIFYKHIVDARKAARAAYATLATGNASRASKAQTMP